MSAYVIWIDSREAKVFKLTPQGPETKHLHAHGHKHHAEPHGKHPHHHSESESLFKDVSHAIHDASEILILGPGEAKTRFKQHLDQHHDSSLSKKIVGIETVDHPTENQILATARKFFKNFDLLH